MRIRSKDFLTNIEDALIKLFQSNSTKGEYQQFVLSEWEKENENIKYVFSSEKVIARSFIAKASAKVYIAKTVECDEKQEIQVEALVISESENINNAFNSIHKYFKNLFKSRQMTYEILENKALLYITKDNDILSANFAVKAYIKKKTLSKAEIVRIIIFILCSVLFLFLAIQYSKNPIYSSVFASLAASSIFWIITELIVRLLSGKEFNINDLSNWLEDSTPQNADKYDEVDKNANMLQSPNIPGWENK